MEKKGKFVVTFEDRLIAWKAYGQMSYYSDNYRNVDGKPEFKVSAITPSKFSCLYNNQEAQVVKGLFAALDYFEQVVATRKKNNEQSR